MIEVKLNLLPFIGRAGKGASHAYYSSYRDTGIFRYEVVRGYNVPEGAAVYTDSVNLEQWGKHPAHDAKALVAVPMLCKTPRKTDYPTEVAQYAVKVAAHFLALLWFARLSSRERGAVVEAAYLAQLGAVERLTYRSRLEKIKKGGKK